MFVCFSQKSQKQMEQFRTYEKETKTKAYSKEGLGQHPKEDAKAKVRGWISKCLSSLSTQLDQFESEIETINAKKRKGGSDQERMEQLEHHVERNKFHQAMLEKILRGLDNDTLSCEQVCECAPPEIRALRLFIITIFLLLLKTIKINEIQDGVEYFIDNNQVRHYTRVGRD